MKTCYKCHQTKPLNEFPIDRSRGDGRGYCCRICKRTENSAAMRRKYATPEGRIKILEANKKWCAGVGKARKLEHAIASRARRRHIEQKGDHILRSELHKRDHGICGLCDRPVILEESSIDHLFPLDKGGPHVWSNVHITHLECNLRKYTKIIVPHPCQYRPDNLAKGAKACDHLISAGLGGASDID